MKRSSSRKVALAAQKKTPLETPPAPFEPEEEVVVSPALEAKYRMFYEKSRELEGADKIRDGTLAATDTFNALAQGIPQLSEGILGIAGVLNNWNVVFSVMAETNTDTEEPDPKWVRFSKLLTTETGRSSDTGTKKQKLEH